MGEYVGAIYTQVQKRPYAVELERINFDNGFEFPKTGPVQLLNNTYVSTVDIRSTQSPTHVPSPS